MQRQEPENNAVTGLIYLIVAVFCAGLSAWSVFHGLAIMPWQLAGLFATIIFLALFMCHYVVLRRRQNGAALLQAPHGLVGPLVLLLFVTVASTSSSFAYFYNLLLRDNLAVSRAQDAGEAFEKNANAAEVALRKLDGHAKIHDDVMQLLGSLETEVIGANRNGFGDKAKKFVEKIETVMRDEVRRPIVLLTLPPLGSKPETDEEAYNLLKRQVVKNLTDWDEADPIKVGLRELTKIRADSASLVQKARGSSSDLSFKNNRDAINDLATKTADMERAVNRAIDAADLPKRPESLKLDAPDAKGIGLTNVVEVWGEVGKGKGLGIAAVSIFLAVLLDLLPFVMAMVLFKPGMARSSGNSRSGGAGGGPANSSQGGNTKVRPSNRWK